LVIAFTAIAVEHGGVITHILPILEDRGVHEQAAVLAASMIGPMQVTGRLAMMAAERHVSIFAIATGCFLGMAAAAACLLFSGGSAGLIAAFIILHGAAYGVTSILRPVITAELLGRQDFGIISGMIALPFVLGYAAAPTLTALAWQVGGYDLVLGLVASEELHRAYDRRRQEDKKPEIDIDDDPQHLPVVEVPYHRSQRVFLGRIIAVVHHSGDPKISHFD